MAFFVYIFLVSVSPFHPHPFFFFCFPCSKLFWIKQFSFSSNGIFSFLSDSGVEQKTVKKYGYEQKGPEGRQERQGAGN